MTEEELKEAFESLIKKGILEVVDDKVSLTALGKIAAEHILKEDTLTHKQWLN